MEWSNEYLIPWSIFGYPYCFNRYWKWYLVEATDIGELFDNNWDCILRKG